MIKKEKLKNFWTEYFGGYNNYTGAFQYAIKELQKKDIKINQVELASKINTTQSHISRVLHSKEGMSKDHLKLFCDMYNIPKLPEYELKTEHDRSADKIIGSIEVTKSLLAEFAIHNADSLDRVTVNRVVEYLDNFDLNAEMGEIKELLRTVKHRYKLMDNVL